MKQPNKKFNCVLIIDDDPLTSLLHKLIVEDADCANEIVVRESAEAGLTYLVMSSGPDELVFPDLIFLDLDMPVMDGWAFLEDFKILKASFPTIPQIIMVTAIIDPRVVIQASKYPELTGFCNKPMTLEMILPLVN